MQAAREGVSLVSQLRLLGLEHELNSSSEEEVFRTLQAKLAAWAGHQTPRAARLAVSDSDPQPRYLCRHWLLSPAELRNTGSSCACPLSSDGHLQRTHAPQCISSINIANLPTSGWAGFRLGPQIPTWPLRENTPVPILHGWPGGHTSRPPVPRCTGKRGGRRPKRETWLCPQRRGQELQSLQT